MHDKLHYSVQLIVWQLCAGESDKAVATAKAMATLIMHGDKKTDYIAAIAMDLVRAAGVSEQALTVERATRCLEAIRSAEEPRQPSRNRPSH